MPKRWTEKGNYAQTLAYRETAAPLHAKMRAKALSKRISVAKMAAEPKPFVCVVTARRALKATWSKRGVRQARRLAKEDRT